MPNSTRDDAFEALEVFRTSVAMLQAAGISSVSISAALTGVNVEVIEERRQENTASAQAMLLASLSTLCYQCITKRAGV